MATSEKPFDLQHSLAIHSNITPSTANPWIKLGLGSAEHYRQ
jgi:hypothetical protein